MRAIPLAAAMLATSAFAQTLPPSATQPPASPPIVAPPPMDAGPGAPADAALAPAEEKLLNWGVLIDVGIPDGVGASAVFRPMTWLRLSAGGTYNVVSGGVRGGVTLAPFYFMVSPTLSAEVGHFFSGDVTPILNQALPGFVPAGNPLLTQVAYDYANLHLGLEFGPPRNFIFFLRAGISMVQTTLMGFEQLVQESVGTAVGGPGAPPDLTLTAQNPTIRLTAPSLKLGFILYF